jgi:hypothetical protein
MKRSHSRLVLAILSLSCSTVAFGQQSPAGISTGKARAPLSRAPGSVMTGAFVTPPDESGVSNRLVSRTVTPSASSLRAYPEQNSKSDGNWGRVLTDIARHLPEKSRYQDAYRRYMEAGDLVTAGHEWTHFLNEYLSLQCGSGVSAYYVLDNHYLTLSDPEGLRGKVPDVPASLRGQLYQLYLVQNGGNARVDPLYLFDEWSAYLNDVTLAVDQLESGKPLNPFNHQAIQPQTAANVLEFMFYGCAVGMAVKQYDPAYYASEPGRKLRAFVAYNAQRSIQVYRKALHRDELSGGDDRNVALMRSFRSSGDTADMRAWVKSDLGGDLANTLLSPW